MESCHQPSLSNIVIVIAAGSSITLDSIEATVRLNISLSSKAPSSIMVMLKHEAVLVSDPVSKFRIDRTGT